MAENTSVAPAKIHPTLAEDTALEPKSSTSHGEDSQDASSPANIMLEGTAKEVEDTSYPTSHGAHLDDPEKIESLPAHLQPASSEASAADEGEKPKRPSLARRQTTRDDSRPPSLHYTLRTRKLYITIFWALILIDSIAIPLVLYFCLHYLTSLSANSVFSISTACLGGISIIEYILRFWRLWRHNSKCRVIGGKRWYLDWFHFNFSAAWIFIMVELIVGTSPDDPPIRLLAMPLSSLCFFFCLSLITQDILRVLKVPQPCRISSLPRGSPFRPGIYHIVEDICAVDGSGGTIFRRRLNARWNASHDFRQMIHRLTLVWSFCMLAVAIATTVLIFTLTNGEIAYIIGWTVPFVGAGFLTLWTFWYVKRCLKHEYANWAQRRGQA